MNDLDKIELTFEKARAMSLTKWGKVNELTSKLFSEIDSRCGFCYLVDEQTGTKFDCSKCLVTKYCDKVQKRMAEIHEELLDEIERTISFIRKVKADDN